jgi:hypothetical protein
MAMFLPLAAEAAWVEMVEVAAFFEEAAMEVTAVTEETTALLSGESAVTGAVGAELEGAMYGATAGGGASAAALEDAVTAGARAGQGLRAMAVAGAVTASAIGRKRKHSEMLDTQGSTRRFIKPGLHDGLVAGRAIGFRYFPNFYTK